MKRGYSIEILDRGCPLNSGITVYTGDVYIPVEGGGGEGKPPQGVTPEKLFRFTHTRGGADVVRPALAFTCSCRVSSDMIQILFTR